MKNCTSCGAPVKGNSKVCPYCDTVLQDESGEGIAVSESKAAEYPMKWHSIVLALLIIGAVLNVLIGIVFIMRENVLTPRGLMDITEYKNKYSELVNSYRFMNVTRIAMGVFQVIVWKRLKGYRSNGPVSLKVMYVLGIVLNIVNLSWMSSAMNTNMFNVWNCCYIIGLVVMLIINSSYYAKRSELFVN